MISFSKKAAFCIYFIVAGLVVVIVPKTASTGIHKWTDDQGVTHFTDHPSKIPKSHRGDNKSSSSTYQKPAKKLTIQSVKEDDEHFWVIARINDKIDATLMVDTGASMTLISGEIAKKLGIHSSPYQPALPFSTPGGLVWLPMIAAKTVEIQGLEAKNLPIAISPHIQGMDGLLGMNFLNEFRVEFDKSQHQISLKPFINLGNELWAGKSGIWWKKKFALYKEELKRYKKKAYYYEYVKPYGKKYSLLVRFYQELYDKLVWQADRAKLPAKMRAAP